MKLWILLVCWAVATQAAELHLWPEYLRVAPDGSVLESDRAAASSPRAESFTGARAGYVSLQVVVTLRSACEYSLELDGDAGLQLDLFREWYHKLERRERYYPDALVPLGLPYRSRLPDPDNRIPDQTAQGFWIDVWIPANAQPGQHSFTVRVKSAEGDAALKVPVRVLAATVPSEDVVTIDHNSYGSSWIGAGRGSEFYRSDAFFRQIHAYHRIFYEHRGVFHQLGYGHAGKVGPEFAPALEGEGRRKHIVSWDLFDRHYGPLLDGTAFAGTRRGARAIPFAYLPVNPEWPASYLWWGEPGYEAEFVNVVSEMERHFREKGWTHTRMELFFNHKKRYMGFPWDGDEVRFPEDNRYFREYARLLGKAMPAGSPVQFVVRADVSWDMEQQSKELAGVIKLWCAGGGILSWYPEMARMMKARGDIVWFYGGPPNVREVSDKITTFPLQAWLWGIDGFVHWLTVSAGDDPWFRFDGGGTALVYPGERFGIDGPIPGIRLKIQRNAVQDLALLSTSKKPIDELRREVARRFNGSRPEGWWNPRPAMADRPPSVWSNDEIDGAAAQTHKMLQRTTPDAWEKVHAFVLQVAGEAK